MEGDVIHFLAIKASEEKGINQVIHDVLRLNDSKS